VPDSTSMRRAVSVALVALALSFAAAACGSAKATPGVPTQGSASQATLRITGTNSCTAGPSQGCPTALELSTGTDAKSVAFGTVLQIENEARADQRLQGTIDDEQTFDTGLMHPDDSTTVVLDAPGKLTIADVESGAKVTLTVEPKPGAKP